MAKLGGQILFTEKQLRDMLAGKIILVMRGGGNGAEPLKLNMGMKPKKPSPEVKKLQREILEKTVALKKLTGEAVPVPKKAAEISALRSEYGPKGMRRRWKLPKKQCSLCPKRVGNLKAHMVMSHGVSTKEVSSGSTVAAH